MKLTTGKTVKSASKKKVTLNPSKKLKSHTEYSVKITSKVTDLAGNVFAAKGWKFMTG